MTKNNGVDFQWERVRHVLQYLSQDAFTPNIPITFQPGDIGVCRGSIEETFYRTLMDLGIPLRHSEKLRYQAVKHPRIRFCVINRHITGNDYEVFLLTTFGGATHHQALDRVARNFAMPMGFTKWPVNVPGIKTKPSTFGQNSSSFLFTLTTECEVIPSRTTARVPSDELERIRKFAQKRKKLLYHDHQVLRDSVGSRRSKLQPWAGDGADAPNLTPEFNHSILLDDDVINYGPFVKVYSPRFSMPKSSGIPVHCGPATNTRWILQIFKKDIMHASQYLPRKPLVQSPQSTLPKPYYAKCLRISSKKLMQLIR